MSTNLEKIQSPTKASNVERITEGKCIVCKGEIVELIVKEYGPESGSSIIGLGFKNQFHWVSKGLHCKKCGLMYAFIPKK